MLLKNICDLLERIDSTDRKCFINSKFCDGKSFLHLACDAIPNCRPYNLSLVECLVKEGEDVNAKDNFGFTPLHFSVAAHIGQDVVKYLVNKGADVNIADKNGRTPLHVAAQYCTLEVLKFLVDNGANVKAVDNQGKTSLHLAVQNYLIKAAQKPFNKGKFLIKTAEVINRYFNGIHDTLEMVKYLVDKGSDITAVDNLARNALHHVLKHNLVESHYLVVKESTLDTTDNDDKMPFNEDTQSDIIKMLKYLHKLEIKLEAVRDTEITTLNMADVSYAFEVSQYHVDKEVAFKCFDAHDTDPPDWKPEPSTLVPSSKRS